MRLTKESQYALRCVIYLASLPGSRVVSKRDVSSTMNIPVSFLSKIAQRLSKEGIIRIIRGQKGGYQLIASPADLSILDVIEPIMGKIELNRCVTSPETCRMSGQCDIRKVWIKAGDDLRSTLADAKIENMAMGHFGF